MTGAPPRVAGSASLALALALGATVARAQPAAAPGADYDVGSRAWNGLATLGRLVDGLGLRLEPAAELRWDELGAEDILVLVYPTSPVDAARAAAFVNAGGHLLLADDFGGAAAALRRLGATRTAGGTPPAARFHADRPWAPVASRLAAHPVTDGVDEVVCNHPALLRAAPGATPLVGFSDGTAVVVAGAIGTGRFVALSDPSILVNRMLHFGDNLALVTNALRWLDRGGRARRVVLATGEFASSGEPRAFIDDADATAVDRGAMDLNHELAGLSDWMLTEPAIRAIGGALACLLLAVAAIHLPWWRRSRAHGGWLRVRSPVAADEALAATDDGGGDLQATAAVVRAATDRELSRSLGLRDALRGLTESELHARLAAARGAAAVDALATLERRLRDSAAAPARASRRRTRRDIARLLSAWTALHRALGATSPPASTGT